MTGAPRTSCSGPADLAANTLTCPHRRPGHPARAAVRRSGRAAVLTGFGQRITGTVLVRGDLYDTIDPQGDAGDLRRCRRVSRRAASRWRGRRRMAVRRRRCSAARRRSRRGSSSSPRRCSLNRGIPNEDCALDRPRGHQPVRAQPLQRLRPLRERQPRHLRAPIRLHAGRASHSPARSARACASRHRLRPFLAAPACRANSPTSSGGRRCNMATCSR